MTLKEALKQGVAAGRCDDLGGHVPTEAREYRLLTGVRTEMVRCAECGVLCFAGSRWRSKLPEWRRRALEQAAGKPLVAAKDLTGLS